MSWLKKAINRHQRIVYLFLIFIIATIFTLTTSLTTNRKFALITITAVLIGIHWDLRDGGMISKITYRFGGSFTLRNYLSVAAAFIIVTAIIAISDSFHTPLLMLYIIPIVLASMRGGHRMSIPLSLILVAVLWVDFYLDRRLKGIFVKDAYLYLALFAGLSTATGLIADRLRRAAVDLSALYETGRAINSSLNIKEIMNLVLNIIFLDVRPDVAAIFLFDEKKKVLRLQSHRGFEVDPGDWELEVGRSIVGKAAERSAPIIVSTAHRRWHLEKVPNLESTAAVPVKVGDKLLGVLLVGKYLPHAFSFENVRFLEALAGQAAISIQNAKLYWQTKEWASLDGLTGIYNYRYFSERLDVEWNRAVRYEKPLSLVMVDIDLFKSVNDTYGHLSGDKILRDFAGLLKKHTRETDVVARYGGEEFVIILSETHYNDAYTVAEKLRQVTEETPFKVEEMEEPIKLTISLGIANYPTTAFSKGDLIYQADQALYQAKMQRNTLASPLDTFCQINLPTEIS